VRLLITISIALFIALLAILVFILTYNVNEPNRAEGNDLKYYNRIEELARQGSISLSQVFMFKWESVYIQENPRMTEEELNDVLMFFSNTKPIEDWFGYPFRLLFVNENRVVYDFRYDQVYLRFSPEEIIIKREDANFKVIHKLNALVLTLIS
jgi:hypothetical protein